MRLNITATWARATALHDVIKQVDTAVQRQIGANLTYIPVLSDSNNAIVLSDFQGLDEIDTDRHYWANGQWQNVSNNGTSTGETPQGIIIEEPAGKQLSLICRGRNVTEQTSDCAQKAAFYMIDPFAQHGNGTSLSRRDDGENDLANIIGIILGGAVTAGGVVGGVAWKIYASKKKARTAAEAAAAAEGTVTKGEYSFEVAPRGGSQTPSMMSIESEVSTDAVIITRAAEADGEICLFLLLDVRVLTLLE
jgi:hypothetical protein